MQVKLRLGSLSSVMSEFEDVQSQMKTLIARHSDDDRESFEWLYYELAARAEDLVNSHNLPVVSELTAQSLQLHQVSVRLPPIDLPSFNGNYEHWLPFSDFFKGPNTLKWFTYRCPKTPKGIYFVWACFVFFCYHCLFTRHACRW